MIARRRVLVVNPFWWGPRRESNPINVAFTEGLRETAGEFADCIDLEYITTAETDRVEIAFNRAEMFPSLIYACGSVAMQAAVATRPNNCPVLYWGAHPCHGTQGVRRPPLPVEKWVYGLVLRIPLFEDYRQFRVLRVLFPALEAIYGVFANVGGFCKGEAERVAQPIDSIHSWRESASGQFPALSKVAEIIDVKFFEHIYSTANSLAIALRDMPARSGDSIQSVKNVVVTCSDCYHVPGAVDLIPTICHERRIPYLTLSRLDFHEDAGPLLSMENDWIGSSRKLGRLAGQLLKGEADFPSGVQPNNRFQARYYERHAANLGLELPAGALERLQRAIGEVVRDNQYSAD